MESMEFSALGPWASMHQICDFKCGIVKLHTIHFSTRFVFKFIFSYLLLDHHAYRSGSPHDALHLPKLTTGDMNVHFSGIPVVMAAVNVCI